MKTKLMILFAALCVAVSVSAQSADELFNKGLDYYNAGNYTQAFSYFEKTANQGFATAQNNLSQMYEYGLGVTKDLQKSAYWEKKYEENPNK